MILHEHHIIPIHAGGTNDSSNLTMLTVEEHAEAHKLLYEKYGRWEDRIAWLGLSGMISKVEIIEQIQLISASKGGKIAAANGGGFRGRKHSKETKQKISSLKKGNTFFKGRKHSEETKRKMRLVNRNNENNSQFGTKWITNGIDNKKIHKNDPLPLGWSYGRT
jgi:hypothetical protein